MIFSNVSSQRVSSPGGFTTDIALEIWEVNMLSLYMSVDVCFIQSVLATQITHPFLIGFISVAVFTNILIKLLWRES